MAVNSKTVDTKVISPGLPPAVELTLGGKTINLHDDVFSSEEVERMHITLLGADFTCLHASKESTRDIREWNANFDLNDLRSIDLCEVAKRAAEQYSGRQNLELYSGFCNAFRYGDETFTHHDSSHAEDISVLYYVNSKWERDWAGETLFFDDENSTALAVCPVPGRLIVFSGDVSHRSGLPSKGSQELRLTFSMRFRAPR